MTPPAPPQIDYPAWQFWFNVFQLLGLVALGIYTWWRDREKVTAKRFKLLEDQVKDRPTRKELDEKEKEQAVTCGKHQDRTRETETSLRAVAVELQHLPSQADIGKVHSRMDAVSREMNQALGELKAATRQLDLVLEELLRRDKS